MKELFPIKEYCSLHNIDLSFVYSLQHEGLITIITTEEKSFIDDDELHRLEIFTRWHEQLGIGPENMDIIDNLLEKIKHMQQELNELRNRLA